MHLLQKNIMRGKFLLFFSTSIALIFCWINYSKSSGVINYLFANSSSTIENKSKSKKSNIELSRLKNNAHTIGKYAVKNNYNSEYCFLLDMKLPSGSKRFFVYNLKKDSIMAAGLVAHGSGSDTDSSGLIFSNSTNSHSTSLGKYKVANSYYGKFGLAFKLHGLDKTNSNAFNRFVVLHSHSCVPEDDVTPEEICRSYGCPTVAPSFLVKLKNYIDKSDKPVLMDIFY